MSGWRQWPGHTWLALGLRWYLGVVFIAASLHKIAHPQSFALTIATYDILPLVLVNPMAIVLPYVEVVAGVMLIVGLRVRAAALLVLAMMVVFTIAVALALAQGIDASCGCFAAQSLDEDPISLRTVARDLGWTVAALYVLLVDRRPLGLDGVIARWRREHG
jgi:uncharacterized membrane protein YphA (DoxX/SURF4 family)